jgi:hypothetical protein
LAAIASIGNRFLFTQYPQPVSLCALLFEAYLVLPAAQKANAHCSTVLAQASLPMRDSEQWASYFVAAYSLIAANPCQPRTSVRGAGFENRENRFILQSQGF